MTPAHGGVVPAARPTPSAATIDTWLPQTQCTRCGYPHCRAYADAIARGEADINRCPPGGETTLAGLAQLLDTSARPLDPGVGPSTPRLLARVIEAQCIGCTLCLKVCPVDAIVGAPRRMHTVIAAQCTGCELCVPPCPVDCIELAAAPAPSAGGGRWPDFTHSETEAARRHAERRRRRLARSGEPQSSSAAPAPSVSAAMRREIAAAVARVRRRRGGV